MAVSPAGLPVTPALRPSKQYVVDVHCSYSGLGRRSEMTLQQLHVSRVPLTAVEQSYRERIAGPI